MHKKIALALALTFAVSTLFFAACAKNGKDVNSDAAKSKWYAMNAVSNSYKYPEYTGEDTLDWKQTIEFHQIPPETLERMNTEGLIESCLDYPFYSAGMIFSNSTVYDGFLRTRGEFNGLQELMKRADAPQKLLELYAKAAPDGGEDNGFRMCYLNYIMAQDEILNGLSKMERKALADECMNKLERYELGDESIVSDAALMIAVKICMKDSEAFRELVKQEPWIKGLASGGLSLNTQDGRNRLLEAIKEYRAG